MFVPHINRPFFLIQNEQIATNVTLKPVLKTVLSFKIKISQVQGSPRIQYLSGELWKDYFIM